jgi:hypothetical protein
MLVIRCIGVAYFGRRQDRMFAPSAPLASNTIWRVPERFPYLANRSRVARALAG